ncbi:MAG: hypothetical protein ABEI99_07325 [Halobaculum sp.]
MARWPRYSRYLLSGIVLGWIALGEVSVMVFAYSMMASAGLVPPVGTAAALVANPAILAACVVAFVGTAALGRRRYGSLAAATVAVARWLHEWVGWPPMTGEPTLEGRVRHDGATWRIEYWGGDEYEVVGRECPFCGRSLVEAYLPRHEVHGPNSAFDEPDDRREQAAETWETVLGQRKYEDREETEALACPRCDFSIPGDSDVQAGRDGAVSTFRRHVERMRSVNPASDPFESYRERAGGAEATPADVWDAYARDAGSDAVPVGVSDDTSSFDTGDITDGTDSARPTTARESVDPDGQTGGDGVRPSGGDG